VYEEMTCGKPKKATRVTRTVVVSLENMMAMNSYKLKTLELFFSLVAKFPGVERGFYSAEEATRPHGTKFMKFNMIPCVKM
jgi:hypothetical protein